MCEQVGVAISPIEAQGLFRRYGYESVMPYERFAYTLLTQPSRQLAEDMPGEFGGGVVSQGGRILGQGQEPIQRGRRLGGFLTVMIGWSLSLHPTSTADLLPPFPFTYCPSQSARDRSRPARVRTLRARSCTASAASRCTRRVTGTRPLRSALQSFPAPASSSTSSMGTKVRGPVPSGLLGLCRAGRWAWVDGGREALQTAPAPPSCPTLPGVLTACLLHRPQATRTAPRTSSTRPRTRWSTSLPGWVWCTSAPLSTTSTSSWGTPTT